jgi:hypothetical protein
MPETFAPFTWIDGAGGGTPITAAQLNRLENGLESMDDRAAALELGVHLPVSVTYASSVTLNAALGSLFRVTATGNLTLANITGGFDGQLVWLEVEASGGTRAVTVGGVTDSVAAGSVWMGAFRYKAAVDEWRYFGTGGGGASTTAPRFITPPVTIPYSSSVTLDAAASSVFWCTATGNLTLANITGGVDGQELVFGVEASGADRTLTVSGGTETIPSGQVWLGVFRYRAAGDTWWRVGSGGGGSGAVADGSITDAKISASAGISLAKTADSAAGSGRLAMTTAERAKLAGLEGPLVHAVGNSGTALTLDAASPSGSIKTVTLSANCTFTLTGATTGQATTLELVLTQDGTGARTVTWPTSVRWSGGTPALSTAAGAVDRIVLTSYTGGTTWLGDLVGKAYA